MAAGGIILIGIGVIAAWLAESPRVGGYFAGGLLISLLLLAAVACLLLRGIREFLRRSPWKLPSLTRQGLANLYRQGNQAQAILVALGLGVMFTLERLPGAEFAGEGNYRHRAAGDAQRVPGGRDASSRRRR